MKEATIHVVEGKPDDIHINGQEGMPIDAFLLLTKRKGHDEGHMLVFGSSETAARMIVNLFRWSIRMDPEAAATLEIAARDIAAIADAARGLLIQEDGPTTVM